MDSAGWVHLWRCSEGHPEVWGSGPLCWQIWTLLLMRANGTDKTLKDGTSIPRGSLVTSHPAIREACKARRGRGWTYPALGTVKYWISWLNERGIVDCKADRRGLFITVCKYNEWNPTAGDSCPNDLSIVNRQATVNYPLLRRKEGKEGKEEHQEHQESITRISNAYISKIHPRARLTSGAKKKIVARLGDFTEHEILGAIDNFAADSWRMENNADKGMVWWFKSEDQVVKWIGLQPRSAAPNGTGGTAHPFPSVDRIRQILGKKPMETE